MTSPKHTIRNLAAAVTVAAAFMMVVYYVANFRIPLSEEKTKLQLFEKIRALCFGESLQELNDSVVMVDVHYDKELVMERDDGLPNGFVPVTSRQKLFQLLSYLHQRGDYRYIVLDVFLEKSVSQDGDSTLYQLISQMPRIVTAMPLKGELADSCLYRKAGLAQYGTAVWENDFVKYSYLTDSTKSMALKMYEELTGHTITPHRGWWYTDRGLARNSVILTYEFRDEEMTWDLGSGLLGDTLDGRAGQPELYNIPTKDRYFLIGDFEDDRHQTLLHDMSGTTIIFNAYLTLLHRHHVLSFWTILSVFIVFCLLAWLTITRNQRFEWLCSYIGMPAYLFLLSLLIYLICREAYDVLVATTLFWLLKAGLSLLRWLKNRQKDKQTY